MVEGFVCSAAKPSSAAAGLCLLRAEAPAGRAAARSACLGARSVNRAPQLCDLKIEMRDQRATLRQFSERPRRRTPSPPQLRSAPQSAPLSTRRCRPEARKDRRPRITMESQNRPPDAPFALSSSRFSPYPTAVGRHVSCTACAAIDARQQIGKLGRRDRHRSVSQRWPQESLRAPIALRTRRIPALAVAPKTLDQRAPRRPRKTKRWPECGSRLNVSWTISARPSRSLCAYRCGTVTSHTRAPLGIGIIAVARQRLDDPGQQIAVSACPPQQ